MRRSSLRRNTGAGAASAMKRLDRIASSGIKEGGGH